MNRIGHINSEIGRFSPGKLNGESDRFTIYAISFLTDFAYLIFIFTASRHLAETGSSLLHLGILGAISSGSYALSAAAAGHFSDTWGRKRLVVLGAVLHCLTLLVCCFWQTRTVFYLMGGITGVAVGMVFPPAIAWLTEGNQDASATSKLLFRFCIAWNLGMIAGQITAGRLFSIRHALPLPFGILAMAAVAVLVLKRHWADRGAAPEESEETTKQESPSLALARSFVYLSWAGNLAGALTMSMLLHLLPHLINHLKISAPVHGLMLGASRLVVIATYSLMHSLTFWRYRLYSSMGACLLAVIGLALIATGTTVAVLTSGLLLAAVLLGFNYFASLFYSTMGFGDSRKGLASGIHEGTLAVGSACGALGGGAVGILLGPRAPYYACIAALLVSAGAQIGIYFLRRGQYGPCSHANPLRPVPEAAGDARPLRDRSGGIREA